MKSEDRKIIKQITRHKDLDINLPIYINSYMRAAYEYNMIRMVLNYYTIKEVKDEGGSINGDEALLSSLDEINSIIFEAILSNNDNNDNRFIERLEAIRNDVTSRMHVLTAYTDALQIYEYVLNRVEYGITGERYEVSETDLAERIFRYLFSENDKMVINSKIQMVTAQLPIRMTKSRFFDYLSDTLNIYNGSDITAVDDFVDMLKSSALLKIPDGYGNIYKDIYNYIESLEHIDYRNLSLDTYSTIMEQFGLTTSHLTDIVSNHLLSMEIVNALYSVVLARPYINDRNEESVVCENMLRELHSAYISEGDIPDSVDSGFEKIEGRQEILGEDLMQYESVLPDIIEEAKDAISRNMVEDIFTRLNTISQLMSNSLFIDLEAWDSYSEAADSAYVNKKRDELVKMFSDFFSIHSKEINRAVMASAFSNMPVLFNSMQETKDYIEYSLEHCKNESELMAFNKIMNDMMEE